MHGSPAPTPCVTVIVVGTSPAPTFRATLASVLAQTERSLEIRVVAGREVLAALHSTQEDRAARFLLHACEPDRPWRTVEECINDRRTPWVKIVHAGNLLHPTCIARELGALDACRTARAVFSLPELVDEVGAPIDDRATVRALTLTARDGEALALELVERNPVAAATVLFARDAACASGALDLAQEQVQAGEYALWLGLCLDHPVVVLPEQLARVVAPATRGDAERAARVDVALAALERLRFAGWQRLRTAKPDRPERAFVDLARALLRSGFVELEPYARELAACVRSFGAPLPREPVFERLRGLASGLARMPIWTTATLSPRGAEGPTSDAFAPAAAPLRARLNRIGDALAAHADEQRESAALVASARQEAGSLRVQSELLRGITGDVLAKLQITKRVAAFAGRNDEHAAAFGAAATSVEPIASMPPVAERLPDHAAIAAARRELRDILAQHPERRGCAIFAPTLRWTHELFQRPHQLALELARQGDLVFFGETLWTPPDVVPFRKLGERLYAAEVQLEVLSEIDSPVVYFLSYNAYYVTPLTRPRTVYELIDELAVFQGDPVEIRRNHEYLLDTADVVVATASSLLQQVQARRPDAILCPNAVDYEHFRRARSAGPVPADLASVLRPGRRVIGYYGALAAWLDYDLVRTAALERPDLEFVLIGPDYDGSLATTDLLSLGNVHRLESRPYAELPDYLRAFDVATIPFVVNEITESTSPIKLYEYLAAGKPVVTTAMRECMRAPETLVARDAMEFVARIADALALAEDPAYHERSDAVARANTWAARVRQLRAALAVAPRRGHAPQDGTGDEA